LRGEKKRAFSMEDEGVKFERKKKKLSCQMQVVFEDRQRRSGIK